MKDSAMLAGICWVFQGFLALLILPAEKRLFANSIPLSLSLYIFFKIRRFCGERGYS